VIYQTIHIDAQMLSSRVPGRSSAVMRRGARSLCTESVVGQACVRLHGLNSDQTSNVTNVLSTHMQAVCILMTTSRRPGHEQAPPNCDFMREASTLNRQPGAE